MHKHRIIIISLIATLFLPILGFGQDLMFSQYYANPVYLNPALAGNKICPRVTFNYRNQYPGLSPHYSSYCAGADMYIDQISGGIAFQACADMSEVFGSYSANLAYSYHLRLNRKLTLNAALQAGYYQYRLNWGKLIFEDMITPGTGEIISGSEAPPERLSVGDVDFASGGGAGIQRKALPWSSSSSYNDARSFVLPRQHQQA